MHACAFRQPEVESATEVPEDVAELRGSLDARFWLSSACIRLLMLHRHGINRDGKRLNAKA